MIKKPCVLAPGATLGIVAPASPVYNPDRVANGKKVLENRGFKVSIAPHALNKNKYLAGTDGERLADLHRMFLDPYIDGIICLRGGYGSMRVLSKIDYGVIRRNPKVLVGYSDITALHLAIWKKTGLVTFSGPMLATEFGYEQDDFTLDHFFKAVTSTNPLGVIPSALGNQSEIITPGRACGRLIGGNLSLVAATLGTPYELDTRETILFLEEVDEEPYRVDRMLQQLLLAGKLSDAAGVVFGECVNCEAKEHARSFSLLEVIRMNLESLKIPCFYGLRSGHGSHKATLPLGVTAEMDAEKCLLAITESATVAL